MDSKIFVHNPYTNKLEEEIVYGENWLRFIYSNPLGKLCLWALIKRAWFSKWYGWRMNQKKSAAKIEPFIEKFKLDPTEFKDDLTAFQCFNDFFFRKLRNDSRQIVKNQNSVIFPADGRHLGFQNVDLIKSVFVKGQNFNLEKLFRSVKLAKEFAGGTLVLSRLCPVDYHRFHFPVSGKFESYELINGSLCSVNPIALRKNLGIFWQNKRYLCMIDNKILGKVAVLLIGATCVGSVHLTANPNNYYEMGDELGYFSFGGSSVITVFQPDKIKLDKNFLNISSKGCEFYSKVGESMGEIL